MMLTDVGYQWLLALFEDSTVWLHFNTNSRALIRLVLIDPFFKIDKTATRKLSKNVAWYLIDIIHKLIRSLTNNLAIYGLIK